MVWRHVLSPLCAQRSVWWLNGTSCWVWQNGCKITQLLNYQSHARTKPWPFPCTWHWPQSVPRVVGSGLCDRQPWYKANGHPIIENASSPGEHGNPQTLDCWIINNLAASMHVAFSSLLKVRPYISSKHHPKQLCMKNCFTPVISFQPSLHGQETSS